MKLQAQNPPHIHSRFSAKTIVDDVLLVLLALYLMATYYYGPRALLLGLFSAIVGIICDMICKPMLGQHINVRERSSLVTALLLPLMMPASIDFSIVAVAVVFALVVVKHPFGGIGHNLFNPAAGGIAFAAICFPTQIFSYPPPLLWLEPLERYTGRLLFSAAYTLKAGGIPASSATLDMLLGNNPGPMGATNVLVVLSCLIYLWMRGTVRIVAPISFLAAAAAVAFFFPRVNVAPTVSVMYELSCGILIFGAVFMITDPVTLPKRSLGVGLYAALAGVATMLFRYFGGFEEGLPFALLLCNTLMPAFDSLNERLMRVIRRHPLVSIQNKKA